MRGLGGVDYGLITNEAIVQERRRQREKELAELEQILRQSNDIVDDPGVVDPLRRRMGARRATTSTQYVVRSQPAPNA